MKHKPDLNRAIDLIESFDSAYKATEFFNQQMELLGFDYRIGMNTLSGMKKGRGRPAMVALVIMVLERYRTKK